MTQEEKAKAYDEALERAKQFSEHPLLEDSANIVEYIFPELVESEDERVRKAILELVRQSSEVLDKQNQNNMIAWLEKQGDKDKLIKELGEYKVKYTQEVLSQQLEKQAKKKSQRMISAEAKEALYGKPAWSEEDEKMLDDAIGAVGAADYYTYDDKQEIERWLKSLKERYTWKPSDEQMDALHYVFQHYTPNATDRLAWDSVITLELMYRDLKKLRGE